MNSIKTMAVEIDERINELQEAFAWTETQMANARINVRKQAGQTRRWGKGDFVWDGDFADALEICNTADLREKPRQAQAAAAFFTILDNRDQIRTEIRELDEVYSEEKWTRAYLVTNSNGHIHKTTYCSTCFDSTRFEWLTAYSADDEAEIVRQAGELACTVCYPSAPADILNQPCTIQSKTRAEKEAASKAAAEAKAAREAKRKASAPTASGEYLTVPSRWDGRPAQIKTERSAVIAWNDAQADIDWKRRCGRLDKTEANTQVQRIIEQALAEKHGVTADEKRAELAAKYAKKRK